MDLDPERSLEQAATTLPGVGDDRSLPDDAPSDLLAAGDRVGRYIVRKAIGAGGMGVVYLAQDPELDRLVALKLLHRSDGDEDARERLLREAKATARLAHPNVVSVFDVGPYEGGSFVALEYVHGGTLRQWLHQPGRAWVEIVQALIHAGHGLAAAHAAGLVHRDFKPENVLVGDDGRPRVLDFGLARVAAPAEERAGPAMIPAGSDATATVLSTEGGLIGTPAYMAPEQHLGEGADARTDQFSFCVALYEALHGARPFAGDDLRTLSLSIVRGELSTGYRSPRVPDWLNQALERGLRVAPERRFGSMRELLATLRARGAESLEPADDARAPAAVDNAPGDLTSALAIASAGDPLVPSRRSGEDTFGGLTASLISIVHHRSPLAEASLDLVEVELRHLLGKGDLTRVGRGLSWTSRRYCARLSPTRTGAELLLERDVSLLAKGQALLGLVLGCFCGLLLFVTLLESAEWLRHAAEPVVFLLFLALAGLFGRAGVRVARQLHERSMGRYRQRLDYIAGRLSKASEEGALARIS
ncbi:MAG: serine/threonine-protein kinase [Nannocystaceae bacterium]